MSWGEGQGMGEEVGSLYGVRGGQGCGQGDQGQEDRSKGCFKGVGKGLNGMRILWKQISMF